MIHDINVFVGKNKQNQKVTVSKIENKGKVLVV